MKQRELDELFSRLRALESPTKGNDPNERILDIVFSRLREMEKKTDEYGKFIYKLAGAIIALNALIGMGLKFL